MHALLGQANFQDVFARAWLLDRIQMGTETGCAAADGSAWATTAMKLYISFPWPTVVLAAVTVTTAVEVLVLRMATGRGDVR